MVKRFSRLKYALKTLKTPGAIDDTGVAPVAPAGTVLAKFQKAQTEGVEYGARAASSKTQGLVQVAIIPFALGSLAANAKSAGISKRAKDNGLFGTLKAESNIIDYVAADHPEVRGFVPAKAIVFQRSAQLTTEKTSKITGIKYNPVDGSSYTFPYGNKASGTLTAVRADINAKAKTVNASVSFKPEKYPD